jgi:hypothetical protein
MMLKSVSKVTVIIIKSVMAPWVPWPIGVMRRYLVLQRDSHDVITLFNMMSLIF